MNLEELIKKYQRLYYVLDNPPSNAWSLTREISKGKAELAKEIANDLIDFQTEVKERLEAMKSPGSHLNPVLILKGLIE